MKVYLSSTYLDLKHHRAELAVALRKAGYEVVMMEEYGARDETVEFSCQGDVRRCDVYVGIFAWRHGYVPQDGNPERRSITEMEFLAAGAEPTIPRLTFVLDDDAPWPDELRDADPGNILALRATMKKRLGGLFHSSKDLAVEVLAALRLKEHTDRVQRLDAVRQMAHAEQVGHSYLPSLEQNLPRLTQAPFIEVRLGPTPWWHSRLHLVAALAADLTRVKAMSFVDAQGRFLALVSPAEVRKRLAQRWPELAELHRRLQARMPAADSAETRILSVLDHYMDVAWQLFQQEERQIAQPLSREDVLDELGFARIGDVVTTAGKRQQDLLREIIGRPAPFVVLVEADGSAAGIIDRVMLLQDLANAAIAHP